jgi:hypothetical protein
MCSPKHVVRFMLNTLLYDVRAPRGSSSMRLLEESAFDNVDEAQK